MQPTFHSKVSSGLSSRDFYDWPEHAPEDFEKYDPEVAVFWIGTNDAKSAPQDVADDDAWRDDYTVRVEEMLSTLIGDGRTVYWVGTPVMKDRSFAERVEVLNELAAAVVAKHPEAHYVDAYTLFADPDGKYTASLTDEDGDPVLVRAGDGVHLTPDGGDVIAQAVYEHLDPLCDLRGRRCPERRRRPSRYGAARNRATAARPRTPRRAHRPRPPSPPPFRASSARPFRPSRRSRSPPPSRRARRRRGRRASPTARTARRRPPDNLPGHE